MPKSFNKCVSAGGRVRRKTIPGKGYINLCFKGGKSFAGEMHRKRKVKAVSGK